MSDSKQNLEKSGLQWQPLDFGNLDHYDLEEKKLSGASPYESGKQFNLLYVKDPSVHCDTFDLLYAQPGIPSVRAAFSAGSDAMKASQDQPRTSVPSVPVMSPDEPEDSDPATSQTRGSESLAATEEDDPEQNVAFKMEEGFREGFIEGEKEGYDAGFKKGEQEGYETGMLKADEIVAALKKVLTAAEGGWKVLLNQYEQQILQLICRIAEKVVYGQAAVDHDIVKKTIMKVFETVPDSAQVTVTLNPEDYDHIQRVKNDFIQAADGLKEVALFSDSSVPRGGCSLKAGSGQINTSLESRLEAVQRSVMDVMRAQ